MWEELTELEELRIETYNVARALLDNAYMIWDLDGTTNRDRRVIVERMQDTHKTLCDQIVPIARICQDIKVRVPPNARSGFSISNMGIGDPALDDLQSASCSWTRWPSLVRRRLASLVACVPVYTEVRRTVRPG